MLRHPGTSFQSPHDNRPHSATRTRTTQLHKCGLIETQAMRVASQSFSFTSTFHCSPHIAPPAASPVPPPSWHLPCRQQPLHPPPPPSPPPGPCLRPLPGCSSCPVYNSAPPKGSSRCRRAPSLYRQGPTGQEQAMGKQPGASITAQRQKRRAQLTRGLAFR